MTAPPKPPAKPVAKNASPAPPPKTKEEAELEAKIARKILEKNPKLRDAGFNTAWIVERQSTARKGQKAPQGALDAIELDDARQAYEDRIASIETQIQALKLSLEDERHAARIAVEKWVAKHGKPAEQAGVKQALQLRRSFLDAIGFKERGSGGAE